MADAFRVDPEALGDATRRMTAFQRHVEEMLVEIDSRVQGLHAAWTGDTAAAHAEAHRQWVRGEAMMRQALAELRTAGETAHRNYTGAVARNLSMWA
ncbi:WXG100 family type VII secretion target [Mycobacterium sp. 050134]|uniref:WXG100 family type VII secretion target n=1 Tax=Mycobacterium sp. 050134 TaxID=3096111 RepID=UPI002EDAB4BE